MAAYRRVHDSRHLQADCQEPGSAPEPYARQSSTGYLYLLQRPIRGCISWLHRTVPAIFASILRSAGVMPLKSTVEELCHSSGEEGRRQTSKARRNVIEPLNYIFYGVSE